MVWVFSLSILACPVRYSIPQNNRGTLGSCKPELKGALDQWQRPSQNFTAHHLVSSLSSHKSRHTGQKYTGDEPTKNNMEP